MSHEITDEELRLRIRLSQGRRLWDLLDHPEQEQLSRLVSLDCERDAFQLIESHFPTAYRLDAFDLESIVAFVRGANL